ncbi:glycosyltransferase [Pseudomethylobacillus aquaticus]|uniref:Glycosyltransferase n=1 Tax=Pseudomethylobacillus aquaticus TaxID=2676064 RepID=A0A3N0UXZ1_9PROT|nr:glycosyltransferase [Pseudomethylobacillus aquaticus]ROH85323.1 glycosyltransferase [Pseudomethylobacillus aquaticus]
MIRVFIGFDPRETAAFAVLSHSIHQRASEPVCIAPVMLSQLKGIYRRELNPLQSTEFSFSRFLVPYLSAYEGWSIFMDCDMLMQDDIAQLWAMRDERYAVQCVQHDHKPREDTKFLGAVQTRYQKKNWSSVMLFNNARCKQLTPDYVNTASGLELHQFKWLADDAEIGALPQRWNHLVGYTPPDPDAALVHFTSGGPYFNEYAQCEHSDTWRDTREQMLTVVQRAAKSAAA